MRLDEKISKLEATCPGPRLATCEAWIEHLQSKQSELEGTDAKQLHDSLHNPELAQNAFTTTSSTSAYSQEQQTLPSHVIENGVLHIDGFTAEKPFPYNNNKAVAFGKVGVAGSNNKGTSKSDVQNRLPPFNPNPTAMNGIVVGGYGTTRLLPSNTRAVKTPTEDLVNVSTIS